MTISNRLTIVACATALAALTACGGASGAAPDSAAEPVAGQPILIGAALAATSPVSLLGLDEITGVRLAEQYVNSGGGVAGRPIKVVVQDTAGDETGAIKAFRTLIDQQHVVAIVGPTISQQAFSADPVADRAGVPVLGPSNTAAGIPQIGPYIGRVSAPASQVQPNSLNEALTLDPDIKRVAVAFAENDAYSRSETKTFQQAVRDHGLNLAKVVTFKTTDTDFTAPAGALVDARPQLVIVSGLAADGGSLIKRVRQLGYRGPMIGGNGLNTPNLFKPCGRGCHGLLIAQAYSPATDNAVNRTFVDTYRSLYGRAPAQLTAQAFTGIQVIAEALQTLDRREPIEHLDLRTLRSKLNDQILAGNYSTPLGQLSFTPDGEVVQTRFFVATVAMEDDTSGTFTFGAG